MAALCTMGNKAELIQKICVARNEEVGIYGFVFYRGNRVLSRLIWNHADFDHQTASGSSAL